MLLALIALHAILGTAVLVGARRFGRSGLLIGGVAPALTMATAVAMSGQVLDGDAVTSSVSWVPQLGLDLDLRLDAFSLLMVVLVSGIGSLVFLYGWKYFGASPKAG